MTTIGIVGFGYVGKAVYNLFKNHYNVLVYDPIFRNEKDFATQNRPAVEGVQLSLDNLSVCSVIFVCVPTNQNPDGSCDTSIVETIIANASFMEQLFIIKSTVEPGTTERLANKWSKRVVFSPEYIGESNYDTGSYSFNKEMKRCGWFTFGGKPELTEQAVNVYQRVCGPDKQYVQTTSKAAELAKYMENAWLATKVTICHEFNEICNVHKVSYNQARELWLLDPRITKSHTSVFFDRKKPFDGKCLPKDLNAIIHSSQQHHYNPTFLSQVVKSNEALQRDLPRH